MIKKMIIATCSSLLMVGCSNATTQIPKKEKVEKKEILKIDKNTKKAVTILITKVEKLEKKIEKKKSVEPSKKLIEPNTKVYEVDEKILKYINEK